MPQVKKIAGRNYTKPALIAAGGVSSIILIIAVVMFFMTPTAPQAADRADQLNAEGKYSDAVALLNRARWRALSDADRAIVVSRLAASYSNMDQNEKALGYRLELEKLDPSYTNSMSTAELAQRMGKKDVARAAYGRAKKAAEKLPEDVRAMELEIIEQQLEELK